MALAVAPLRVVVGDGRAGCGGSPQQEGRLPRSAPPLGAVGLGDAVNLDAVEPHDSVHGAFERLAASPAGLGTLRISPRPPVGVRADFIARHHALIAEIDAITA